MGFIFSGTPCIFIFLLCSDSLNYSVFKEISEEKTQKPNDTEPKISDSSKTEKKGVTDLLILIQCYSHLCIGILDQTLLENLMKKRKSVFFFTNQICYVLLF